MSEYGGGSSYYGDVINNAASNASSAKRDVGYLEDEVAKLRLACAAMWELLKERGKLTEQDLAVKMAILDAKDGVADGKLTRTVRKCVACGRTVPARQNQCMYCKADQPIESIFESL